MESRRPITVLALAAIILAGATLLALPRSALDITPQEALESSSNPAAAAIASAVDTGGASAIAGLLPTSDLYARAQDVMSGMKAAVPSDAPTLTSAQLDVVSATARGAATAVVNAAPTSTLSSTSHAALQALAFGEMRGMLAQVPTAPNAGTSALAQALASGEFAGAVVSFSSHDPRASPATLLDGYASGIAAQTYAFLAQNGGSLAAIVGSPALSDAASLATDVVSQQLDVMPFSASQAQLDAIGAFAGGEIVGLAKADLASFPHGLPTVAAQELRVWAEGEASGFQGASPWSVASDAAVSALAAWAQSVASSATAALASQPDITPAQATLDDLHAWAQGLAQGGFGGLAGLPTTSPDVQSDANAYAEALTAPAIAYITAQRAPMDPAGLQAYAASLTTGVGTLRGAALDSTLLLQRYLTNLVAAVQDVPPGMTPQQVQMLQAFGAAATDRIAQRLDSIQQYAVAGVDPKLLDAMEQGLVSGVGEILNSTTGNGGDPSLFGALVSGLTTGFLESKDPQSVWSDEKNLTQATAAWYDGILPTAFFGPLARNVGGSLDTQVANVKELGRGLGGSPVTWATNVALGASHESFGSANDLVWIAFLASDTVNATVPTLLDPHVPPSLSADLIAFANSVTANATAITVQDAIDAIQTSQVPGAADAFAKTLLAPLGWYTPSFLTDEANASYAMLDLTLANAANVTGIGAGGGAPDLAALLGAIGDGIHRAQDIANRTPSRASDQANLTSAWVTGVAAPIFAAPVDQLGNDVTVKAAWLSAETTAALLTVSNATSDQLAATTQYANDTVAWILGLPAGGLPDLSKLGTPLLPWANASVTRALQALPPTLSKDDIEAYAAYAAGVAKAVSGLPTPDVMSWTPTQVAAMTTYVGDLAGDAPTVIADLNDLANATKCKLAKDCHGPSCDPQCQCDSSCPPPDNNTTTPTTCQGATDTSGCFEQTLANATERYVTNVGVWANASAYAVLHAMPNASPTLDGILLVHKWATDVLGDHGIVVNTTDPSVAWNGPRGPAWHFAGARAHDISEFANASAKTYLAVVGVGQLNLTTFKQNASPMLDPLVAWEAALQSALAGYYTDPGHFPGLPDAGKTPAVPSGPGDPSVDAAQAWSDAMIGALPSAYDSLFNVSTPAFAQLLGGPSDQLDYVVMDLVARRGMDTVLAEGSAASDFGSNHTRTGALDAFAQGLVPGIVASANGTLVDPAQRDLQLMLAYYTGVAQGGVGAIAGARDAITTKQLPAIQAFAGSLADASWLPAPPFPQEIQDLVAPPSTGSGTGGSSGGTTQPGSNDTGPSPVDPQQQAEDNLQAHAAGMAARAMQLPISPDITTYQSAFLGYVAGVRAAGAALPPVSTDAGYPARLRAWSDAATYGALTHPPSTSSSYYTPSPNMDLAAAYVESFAGASAWSLVDSRGHDVQAALDYATAVAGAAPAILCPNGASAASCTAAAQAVGQAFGTFSPGSLAPQLPDYTQLQPDITAIAGGLVAGLSVPVGVPVDPTATQAAASGIVAALVPAHLGDADAGAVANATAAAVMKYAPQLPQGSPDAVAQAVAAGLLADAQATNQSMNALATGAVAYLTAQIKAGQAPDPVVLQGLVSQFLSSTPTSGQRPAPAVEVDSAYARLTSGELDGSSIVSGLQPITFVVVPPASEPAGAVNWSVQWSVDDPTAATAAKLPLAASNGAYSGTLSAQLLSTLAKPKLKFIVVLSVQGAAPTTFDDNGTPFAFGVDHDLPTSTASAPATAAGPFRVTWTGHDAGSGVASFMVEVQDNGGAFRTLLASTKDTALSFAGSVGHAYSFRVTATDLAGNVGAASALARTVVTSGAADKAPAVAFVSPGSGSSFDSAEIPVTLNVSDADGNAPMVKVCVRRAGDRTDLACPYEGSNATLTLDVSGIPDGRMQLHAIATDGSLTTDALSASFTLARAAPTFLGAAAGLAAGQPGLVTAALSGSPTSVSVRVLDASGNTLQTLALHDDATGGDAHAHDGVWSGQLTLAAGTYSLAFSAKDAAGRAAQLTKSITVHAAPAKNGTNGGSNGGTRPTPSTPTPTSPTPPPPPGKKGFLPGPEVPLVLLGLAALALALRKRG